MCAFANECTSHAQYTIIRGRVIIPMSQIRAAIGLVKPNPFHDSSGVQNDLI